jgi:prolyl-tRNA synthetase
MAEPAEIVKGCMVIKANGYAVWELLQRELDEDSIWLLPPIS